MVAKTFSHHKYKTEKSGLATRDYQIDVRILPLPPALGHNYMRLYSGNLT